MRPFPRTQNSGNKLAVGTLVEYQQQGKYCLGIILTEKRSKFALRNAQNATLELGAERLRIVETSTRVNVENSAETVAYIAGFEERVTAAIAEVDLRDVWELFLEEGAPVTADRICEMLFPDAGAPQDLAVRRVLAEEQPYFKRDKKGELFEARSAELVRDLLHQQQVEQEKQNVRERWIQQALARLVDHSVELPTPLDLIEQLAAQGKSAPLAKEAQYLVDEVLLRAKITAGKSLQQRALDILVALGHFSPHELLTPYRLQRPLRFSSAETTAIAAAIEQTSTTHRSRPELLSITIDGAETKDFDDALSYQRLDDESSRVGVHISDVSALISPGSVLEQTAIRRATSIYCPDRYYPMLPPELSENLLSLVEGGERAVLSCYFLVNDSFEILETSFALEKITIAKRATYDEVDQSICDSAGAMSEYEGMLRFLWEFSSSAEMMRIDQGAVQFSRRELSPIIDPQFRVRLEATDEDTPARKLVSELMVLTNRAAACFAADNGFPLLFRAQEAPEIDFSQQGLEIPEGPARDFFQRSFFKRSTIQVDPQAHFGLGVDKYTQISSPIRRVVDLFNQQQISHFIQNQTVLYQKEQLTELLDHAQKGLDEAFQIQRDSIRYWILQYLLQEKIREIEATVMKTDGARPLAELDIIHSIFPFQTVKGQQVKPGDRVQLAIQSIDPKRDMLVLKLLG